MHLGLGSYAFRWALGTPSFSPAEPIGIAGILDEARDLGCTLVQLADVDELDRASSEELGRIRRRAAAAEIRLQIGTSGATRDRLLRYQRIAVELGADLVRLVLHGDDADPDLHASVAVLRDVIPAFEDAGVVIGIENHFRTASTDLAAIIDAVNSPALGVTLDTANSVMSGEWPSETVRILAPHAVCLHLKDYRVEPDAEGVGGHVVGVPLGDGWLNVDQVLAAVDTADVDGRFPVIVEMWEPRVPGSEETLAAETAARRRGVDLARRTLIDTGRHTFPASRAASIAEGAR